MKKKLCWALLLVLALCVGCAAPTAQEDARTPELVSEGLVPLEYAELFSIERFSGGYRLITAGTDQARYLVVPEGKDIPAGLDTQIHVLRQPLGQLYVASTSMVSLIEAIGALDSVALVGTARDGWYIDAVTDAMDAGLLRFGGKFSRPDYELVMEAGVPLHISNTMVAGKTEVLEKFAELGVPVLIENSAKETHPLGRVEWVKLLGAMLGREAEADAFFERQKALLASASADEQLDITVAMGYLDDETCYIRNGGDYCARLIELAGGSYVCADVEPEKGGNSAVSFEDWYLRFRDADVLIYMNFTDKVYSIDDLLAADPLFADFRAVQNGNVWVTSPAFHQSVAQLAQIAADLHTIFTGDCPATEDYLISIH